MRILPPPQRASWGQNDNSVGVVVSYGEFRASLLGDAERAQFGWWLADGRHDLGAVHVHKASHHASRNGDTEDAIRHLQPDVVVAGLGADNSYGHPHPEALALYAKAGAVVYRTDRHGTVRIDAARDGRYQVRTERAARDRTPPSTSETPCIDLNSAPAEQLQRIPHVGASRAREILALRPFRSLSDLDRVRGIGPARNAKIKASGSVCEGNP